jgi:putative sporulation protein YyaC
MKNNSTLPTQLLNPFKVHYHEECAVYELNQNLQQYFRSYQSYSEIVLMCIGTDRSTGDALGPLVGSKLERMYPTNCTIYGTLDSPVHAVNLQETLDRVYATHHNPLIIGIDACLGQFSSVGKISITNGPLRPGAGVKKSLPEVGHFHITGIVNIGGVMEYFVLQNTRLNLVMKMADVIATSLSLSIDKSQKKRFNRLLR